MAEVQIASMSHRHKAIADWLLMHPEVKNLDLLAEHMQISRSWLSIVMNSDVFKEYFEKRRQEWQREMMGEIGALQLRVMKRAYERTHDLLSDDSTDPRLVFDVANKTAERLFGKTGTAPTAVVKDEKIQEVARAVDAGTLGNAREILRRTVTVTKEVPLDQLPAPQGA